MELKDILLLNLKIRLILKFFFSAKGYTSGIRRPVHKFVVFFGD